MVALEKPSGEIDLIGNGAKQKFDKTTITCHALMRNIEVGDQKLIALPRCVLPRRECG